MPRELPEDEAPDLLVGAPAAYVESSQRYSCVLCHCDVWIAPSSVARIQRFPQIKVACGPCAITLTQNTEVEVLHGTRTEMIRDVGKTRAQEIREFISNREGRIDP